MRVAQLTLTIKDAKANTGKSVYYLDLDSFGDVSGDVVGDLVDYVQELVKRLDPLLTAKISDISVSFPIALPDGIKAFADANSDVEEKARFIYPKTGASQAYYNHTIAGFDHSIFPDNQKIEYGQDATLDYFTALLFNPTEALDWPSEIGGITDLRGEPIINAPTTYKRFKESEGF